MAVGVKVRVWGESCNGADKPVYLSAKEDILQRASVLLCDVEYVIEAHFEMTGQTNATDNPGKFKDIVMRRLRRGECFHMPYFGCREFPAHFCLCEEETVQTAYEDTEETVNKKSRNKKPVANMAAMVFRSVLEDGRYPASLYTDVLMRIRAE